MKHFLIAGLILSGAAGCGYSSTGLIEHRAVKLKVFDNEDERRTQEFELTRTVARELAARGIQVNAPDATVVLEGTILSITEPSVVEGRSDVVVVSAVSVKLLLVLKTLDGRELSRREQIETATFSGQRLESRDTARQEIFDRLARWVVSNLEKDW